MRLSLVSLVLVVAWVGSVGCEKSSKPIVDTPASADPAASSAMIPTPPLPKQGSVPTNPASADRPAEPMPAEAAALATASNKFAFDLWARTNKTPGNTAFSPASISMALAMTGLGAKGETAAQIKKTMHLDGAEEATAVSWGKVSRALTSPSRPLTLRIANRLFGERTYPFEKPYLDKTQSYFGAALEPLDFKGAPDPSRVKVNEWVSERTEKKIVDLLPAGSVDDLTRLVLVNAVYFLADWAEPFEKRSTTEVPFEISASAKKPVPTMHRQAQYAIAQADGVKVLELPYKDGDASMIVVLPEKKDGLAAIEKVVDASKLAAWKKGMSTALVDVQLPRFELSPSTMPLAKDLAALGMPLAFDKDKADFTAIGNPPDPRERLYVSKVQHKVFVKVDEKGTEAAAATAVQMAAAGAAMPPKAIDFHADHPFLFFIVDRATNLILFMGRVSDPSSK